MKHAALFLALLLALASLTPAAHALQDPALAALPDTAEQVLDAAATEPEGGRLSAAVEIAVLLTVLSLLPAVLISLTCFTRIVIVLSFVRRSLSINELPPNPIIIGLALFLTAFVMAPVGARVYDRAYVPYQAGELDSDAAAEVAWVELRTFLLANTRKAELELFQKMAADSKQKMADSGDEAESDDGLGDLTGAAREEEQPPELSFRVVVPAFVLSELKTAFQMGFLLFLPFLVIDLVISSVLLSMGMFMLPPVMISTPFKILLFVLVDGWHLVCESLVTSFVI
jgi:flagellar biosynthetic protein FliP